MNVGLQDFVREASKIVPPPAGPVYKFCGHPKTPENTYSKSTNPHCLICKRESSRRYWDVSVFKKKMGIK